MYQQLSLADKEERDVIDHEFMSYSKCYVSGSSLPFEETIEQTTGR